MYNNYCLIPSQIQSLMTKTMTLDQVVASNLVQVANSKIYLATKTDGSASGSTTPTIINTNISNNANTNTNTNTNIIISPPPVTISNCKTQSGPYCVECVSGYTLSNGNCKVVDINCAFYDSASGNCLGCVPGYNIQQGICLAQSSIVNC